MTINQPAESKKTKPNKANFPLSNRPKERGKEKNRSQQLPVSRIKRVCWAIPEGRLVRIGLEKATCMRAFEKYNGPDAKCMRMAFLCC